MFLWLKRIFKSKSLQDHLFETKKVKVSGVIFIIKKIDIMSHLDGSKTMVNIHQTYEDKRKNAPDEKNLKKVKAHLSDVILAGTVKPVLSRENVGETICIDELFNDWTMAQELYQEILSFTYGKKKMKNYPLNT